MKEKRPKLKSESFKQGTFVPDALNRIYDRLGISATQEKISKKEEKALLAHFANEASSFVPNAWPVIKQKCHVIEKAELVAYKDEKRIIARIAREGDAFVPADLSLIEQACGTTKILDSQETLSFNEKMKNEAGSFLASSKDDLISQTGIKEKSGFWSRGRLAKRLAIPGGALGAAAIVTILAIGLTASTGAALTPAAGSVSFVNLKITPASAKTDENGDTNGQYGPLLAPPAQSIANTYKPESSFKIEDNGNGSAPSLTAKNYSGAQVKKAIKLDSDVAAPKFSTAWLAGSFEKGYLETKQKDTANTIEVKIASSDKNYATNDQIQNMYRQQIVSFLKSNYIYSEIVFANTSNLSEEMSKFALTHSAEETSQIYDIYDCLIPDEKGTDFTTYASYLDTDSETFRASFSESLKQIAAAPLSDNGRNGVLAAVDIAYRTYKQAMKTSVWSPFFDDEYSYERCRDDFIEIISSKFALDSYFFYSDVGAENYLPVSAPTDPYEFFGHDYNEFKQAFQAVRDYLILTRCGTEEDFLDLVDELGQAAVLESENPNSDFNNYLFDPDFEDRDPGDWHHGDGPEDHPDWGHGGEWGNDGDDGWGGDW